MMSVTTAKAALLRSIVNTKKSKVRQQLERTYLIHVISHKYVNSNRYFTSRKILFFVVWPKFSMFIRNACSMVLLSSSWVCCQTENKSIGEI